jgi:hypothetical protein
LVQFALADADFADDRKRLSAGNTILTRSTALHATFQAAHVNESPITSQASQTRATCGLHLKHKCRLIKRWVSKPDTRRYNISQTVTLQHPTLACSRQASCMWTPKQTVIIRANTKSNMPKAARSSESNTLDAV